jgi:hypothetical protein
MMDGVTVKRLKYLSGAMLSSVVLLCSIASSAPALSLGLQWTGWTHQSAPEMHDVGKSGASLFRLPMVPKWSGYGNDWSFYNDVFREAAKNGVTILPHFGGKMNGQDGLPTPTEKASWSAWAGQAVARYGYNGDFWDENPSVPSRPVFAWEMLNEPNNDHMMGGTAPSGTQYGDFLQWAGPAVQNASRGRGTEVLFGGLLAWSGGTGYQKFLTDAYKVPGAPGAFTGFAFHPYLLDAAQFPGESRIQAFAKAVTGARSLLNSLGAGGKSLWITETGWPAEAEYGAGEAGQAQLLNESFNWSKANAANLNLQALIWYNYRDIDQNIWQYRSGLRKENGDFRPSWVAFQEQAGVAPWPPPAAVTGDPSNVQETQAVVSGRVNPNARITSYRFEYGTTTNYGNSIPIPNKEIGSGSSEVTVSVTLPNLQANTRYYYRIAATNAAGTTYGGNRAFTTGVKWHIKNSNSAGVPNGSFWFGLPGQIQVAGDWNGDGVVTPGSYDPITGMWRLRNSNTTGKGEIILQFGGSQYKPVVGDWDGNGTTTVGLYEPNAGNWVLRNVNGNGSNISFQYGGSQFDPVVGDWDGNGSVTAAIVTK